MIEIVFVYRVDLSEKNEKIVAYWSFPISISASLKFIVHIFLVLVPCIIRCVFSLLEL